MGICKMYRKNASGITKFHRAVATTIVVGAVSLPITFSQFVVAQENEDKDVTELSDITVTDDGLRTLSNEPSAASFGFSKPILETPRAVTFVSEEQLRLFGVSTVEDLTRLVPGTYTTTRYGLQGGVNVRGVSADFYYRGMKRLQMQGHVRTVLSAYDNIEVIKGPPSPIYGLGKIGGYANLDPKSNRAKTGKYLTEETGYVQSTVGRYNKNEVQFGAGIPFTVGDRPGGLYIVGLLEDSDTFVDTVEAKQKFIQATVSIDDVVGNFRLETGGQIQNSITSGAYFTRATQAFIDSGAYVTGDPLVNLDLNGDGRVGVVEKYLASPPVGNIGGSNQALEQRYTLPLDANGNPMLISDFANSLTGIPLSMKNYLTTGAGAGLNCPMAEYMRNTAPVLPSSTGLISREMPGGMVLNPCTTGVTTLGDEGYRRNGAFEREQNATQHMFYLDFINDINPDFTFKNQIFYDSIDSFKDSWLPYGEEQKISMFENKFTVTRRISDSSLPDWLTIDSLASINFRKSKGWIQSSGGDYDYRQDITRDWGADGSGTGGFYPNTMFWTQLTYSDYQNGALETRDRNSEYTETGVGFMFDIDIFEDTNIILGARIDKVRATAQDSHNYNETTGNIGTPPQSFLDDYANGLVCLTPDESPFCVGALVGVGNEYTESDSGDSWSISLSHGFEFGKIRPYLTFATTTILLDSSNNMYAPNSVRDGLLIGEAELQELGVKGELFDGQMQWTLAWFNQERSDIRGADDPTIGAFVSSTVTQGVEASVNYQATDKWFIGAAITRATPKYLEGADNEAIRVNGRHLGFQDIVLPSGDIYPAEAFVYGGRTRVLLTDPNNIYDEVPGSPDMQASMNTTYEIGGGFKLIANVQHFSESWASRLQTEVIPDSTIYNVGATWDSERVHMKANIYNATDEITFRAGNSGDPNMVSVLPDMRWELSMKIDF